MTNLFVLEIKSFVPLGGEFIRRFGIAESVFFSFFWKIIAIDLTCKSIQEKTATMNIPAHLHYTKEHEWIKLEGNIATVGITDFAQSELGDIVFVEIETVGKTLAADEIFGSIEAVKTVSDLFLPVSGKILEVNKIVEKSPEKVNEDAYGDGWLIKMEVSNLAEISNLLNAAAYGNLIGV